MTLCENCCEKWNIGEDRGNPYICADCLQQQKRSILYACHIDSDQRSWTDITEYKPNGILRSIHRGAGSPEGLEELYG